MILDILLIAVVVIGCVIGFSKGLLGQLGQLAAVIVGIIGARVFGPTISSWISEGNSAVDIAAGYGIAFVAIYFVVWLLSRMLKSIIHTVHLGIIDRLCGAVFKAAQWLLLVSIAMNIYVMAVPAGADEFQTKPWREYTLKFAPAALGYLAKINNIN